jgi:uncharacterized membrane protein
MQQQRLNGLADGIFAIVMTLLLLELKVPILSGPVSDADIWQALAPMYHTFLSLTLSFALLFTYWRAHHFLVSVYAKSLNVGLANWNALFFFLIILVPFTTGLLGQYPYNHAAIIVYGINVIFIGLTLFGMRRYIEEHPKIETADLHIDDKISGYVRILFPVLTALGAVMICFWDPAISIVLFAFGILFNLIPASTNIVHQVIINALKE